MEHETEPTIRGLGYWAIMAGGGSQNVGGGLPRRDSWDTRGSRVPFEDYTGIFLRSLFYARCLLQKLIPFPAY